MPKAVIAAQAVQLTDIPNIGRSIAADLVQAGIRTPQDVRSMDPAAIYEALRTPMGQRHDPCVLDTFISAVCSSPEMPITKFSGISVPTSLSMKFSLASSSFS